ncbi:MAG: radical SAM protein [Desulfobacteraceae bacterium]|nr:cobalamin B12-binding domain-containing protein [Desulfobacteraceae bacterium]MBC2757424.1 radical SAM protein [Desulfobacteraceae bacterium]MBC2763828.1 radical SAM protein [ANME-2 cluster archaeon]
MNQRPLFGLKQLTTIQIYGEKPIQATIAVPPVFDFYFTRHRFSGLGSEILYNLLRKNGCEVQLFNFPHQRKKGGHLPLPKALDFLNPHIIENEEGRLSFFTRYQRFGPPLSECADQVIASSPDIVFISCFAFCYADTALELASHIRAINPEITIAIGGAGVSAYPDFFIQNPNIDYALAGEAEVSVSSFLNALRSNEKDLSGVPFGVPNLYQKNNGNIIAPLIKKQTDADEIGFVLKKTNTTPKAIYFTTSLSRGCPKRCRFCSNFLCHGRKFRVIPITKIQKGLSIISLNPEDCDKPVYVNFEDDNLLLDPEYFLNVLKIFKKKFSKVLFLAENGVDYTKLTPGLVKNLIDLGMKQFNLSIASTHLPILEDEQRDSTFSLYEKVLQILNKHKIQSITYFICGFKKDSKKTVAANIAYLAKHPTRIGISLFYPVPGIPDFTDKVLFDKHPPFLCAGSSAFPWNQSLNTAELVTAFRLSRFVNLLKSEIKSKDEETLIQKITKKQRLYTLVKKGGTRAIIPVPNADNDMVRLFFEYFS